MTVASTAVAGRSEFIRLSLRRDIGLLIDSTNASGSESRAADSCLK
jgi:hypothetical protein